MPKHSTKGGVFLSNRMKATPSIKDVMEMQIRHAAMYKFTPRILEVELGNSRYMLST
ncbi:hypothetical protein D3C77_404070 [compost metagenome]